MIFHISAFVSAILASTVSSEVDVTPKSSIASSSRAGRQLLSKARLLNDNEERDISWISAYDIKYTGCSSLVQIREDDAEEGVLYRQNIVKFSLCPSSDGSLDDSCSKCRNGADYVVNMMDFLDAYTEYRQEEQERICESIRENCNCNNDDGEDECVNQCFTDQEMDVCIENEDDDEEERFDIQEYVECKELENENNDDDQNRNYYDYDGKDAEYLYGDLFVGPYCSKEDFFSIHLGIFNDEGCSSRVDSELYAVRNNGVELPYSQESIIDAECISCLEVEEEGNNNNNGNNNEEGNELCNQVYDVAARCEENLALDYYNFYEDNTGCEYIHDIIPRLEGRTQRGGSNLSTILALVFAFTTVVYASYGFFLYRKLMRKSIQTVDLSEL